MRRRGRAKKEALSVRPCPSLVWMLLLGLPTYSGAFLALRGYGKRWQAQSSSSSFQQIACWSE